MSPKRGDRSAPPPVGDEFDLRFANTEAANGWDRLSRHAAGNLRRAFDKIRSAPGRRVLRDSQQLSDQPPGRPSADASPAAREP